MRVLGLVESGVVTWNVKVGFGGVKGEVGEDLKREGVGSWVRLIEGEAGFVDGVGVSGD